MSAVRVRLPPPKKEQKRTKKKEANTIQKGEIPVFFSLQETRKTLFFFFKKRTKQSLFLENNEAISSVG